MQQKTLEALQLNPNIRAGLDIVGKVYLSAPEWTGKFAQKQNDHYPQVQKAKTRFGKSVAENLTRYGVSSRQCNLCMLQKNKNEFVHMCRCSHEYCYSCLNSYAISRIEEMSMVVCPQQNCGQVMQLASKVYRYLPDKIKLKYLQNKTTFKLDKSREQNRCQRCFEPKHSGPCKYSLQPKLIDNTFKFRQCPVCKTEIYMTSGKKRVVCKSCGRAMCYLCGQEWRDASRNRHECGKKPEIFELQHDYEETQCCTCSECCTSCEGDSDCCGCCESTECHCDCQCECCRNCDQDFCCQFLFYYGDCDLFCMLFNLLSIPIRLALSALLLCYVAMMVIPIVIVIGFWIFIGIAGGFTVVACELISEAGCPLALLMVVFYPITALFATGYAMYETRQMPSTIVVQQGSMICEMFGGLWINCSPKSCID